ncbi:YdaS family helix-turn-helix protein [Serratia sp. MF2]|uniref:transcriptional regulator n=1 Tax=Serratia sp. MF2 TaxID=3059173 RepID=UPI0027F9E4CD|nr:YdaS family helix-turn-helix protein [Serratia sp. MF2]MDQ7101917.1 YdaS family helix-turn-helix protein [Serratia sp. MF2]
MKHEAVDKAIKIIGSQQKVAEAVNRRQGLISEWLYKKKRVSVSAVPIIVELTGGEVQAHELRPDLPGVFPPPNKPEIN